MVMDTDLDRGNARLLAQAVREWVLRELPGEAPLAERAAATAARAYAEGATVGESCRAAHTLVLSWYRHPANDHLVRPPTGWPGRLAS